jgi:ABC-type phosphate transport system ATPase subunit
MIEESKLTFDQNFRYIFTDLNIITNDLKEKNIESLVEWCLKHKAVLDEMKSNLHFEALKLKVLLLIN